MPTPEAAPEDLRVASSAEIADYLQQLRNENAQLLLSNPAGVSHASRICALDPAADLLGLEIGADPDDASQQLVEDGEITVVAHLDTVKLQFELDSAVIVSGEQGAVLRSPLPTRLYRFQRRQAFRVQPAGSLYPRLVRPGATAALRVLDISIGGVGLAEPAGQPPLIMGRPAAGCVLELDRGTALDVTLLPHHAHPIVDGLGDATGLLRLGCSFVDLSAGAMRALQTYVEQTQKRRRLLKLNA